MGRPAKEISRDDFEKLCGLQCTRDEICSWFGITDKTLNAWCNRTYGRSFSAVYAEKRGAGKISLRRAQFKLAEKSATMAIWLGKQYLGQSDQPITNLVETSEEEDALSRSLRELAERGLESD